MNKCRQCKFSDECPLYKMQNTQQGKFCLDFQDADFNYENFECIPSKEHYWLEINMERNIITEE